ncbi:hypothetical protein ADUPG1_000379 [Aduncisulcus paluster]|uniref:Ribosomal protein S3 n=1 Tax=Aduncisulcus paluster TaxID=2918883 RepID=A0ABQ5K817_9EUKA|nr:hypothetical protein ADUPG1_000379 [Aduncisulcus paluster]
MGFPFLVHSPDSASMIANAIYELPYWLITISDLGGSKDKKEEEFDYFLQRRKEVESTKTKIDDKLLNEFKKKFQMEDIHELIIEMLRLEGNYLARLRTTVLISPFLFPHEVAGRHCILCFEDFPSKGEETQPAASGGGHRQRSIRLSFIGLKCIGRGRRDPRGPHLRHRGGREGQTLIYVCVESWRSYPVTAVQDKPARLLSTIPQLSKAGTARAPSARFTSVMATGTKLPSPTVFLHTRGFMGSRCHVEPAEDRRPMPDHRISQTPFELRQRFDQKSPTKSGRETRRFWRIYPRREERKIVEEDSGSGGKAQIPGTFGVGNTTINTQAILIREKERTIRWWK